ncbi:hypothetical protein KVR01_006262 [Diaporthe batatas]|uniref:uncharacterized protein n=1 Tax=Diaporthe batatas TaxID=748121 RepID=UPI001D054F13|nr:uncharacterized protein KVR01_006262 [Diaporthe batatas]KAG8164344.1 hypothetical protein KVR01_006262 [Diaporthe batatas]
MAPRKELVLITGATGFVGFLTLLDLLKSGYRVRAAVRSQSKADSILATPAIQALSPSKDDLSFVIVSDMAAPGAFDAALQGVTYVVHLAAPVPSFTGQVTVSADKYESYFIRGLVDSHVGMLESAAAAGTVRRVVLTNTVMAVIPFAFFTGSPDVDYTKRFTEDDRQPDPKGPFFGEFDSYAAGKVAALNATEKWVAENGQRAGLDIISILPAAVFGRNEVVSSVADLKADGTNTVLLGLLLGNKGEFPHNGNAVLGEDVARAHVASLDPSVKGNQAFITSTPIVYEDALDVLRTKFPEAVKAGKLSVEGKQPTLKISTDASKTEETLGFKFAPFEKAVEQVAQQYLDLLAKE